MIIIGPITGILAGSSTDQFQSEFFTSVLFPFAVTDEMSILNAASTGNNNLWQVPEDATGILNPSILSGTLVSSIVYQTYTVPTEPVSISNPTMLSGTLVESITYKTYTVPTEPVAISNPTMLSGTLVVTIAYVDYNNGVIENTGISNPTILSGTLV